MDDLTAPQTTPLVAPPESDPEADAAYAAGAARRSEILREKKADAERQARQAATVNAAIWAGLVAAVALAVVLGAVFREQVVKIVPGAASAYAAIGMPVNAAGLLIDNVHAEPSMLQGHKALTVTGSLRNVAARPVTVPAFRIGVLAKDGRTLDQKLIQISAPPLKVGEARPFSLIVADPPPGYQDVSVTFALPGAPPAATKTGAR